MGLITPHFTFAVPQNNFAATPSKTAPGTTLTANATPHDKGAWAQLFATANYDVWAISFTNNTDAISAGDSNILLDIGVGAAASEVVVVKEMVIGGAGSSLATGGAINKQYWLPIYIPKGARVAARIQSLTTVKTTSILMVLHGGPSAAPWPAFSGVDCIGADPLTSGGLALTAGNTGTESAWTNIGSTTTRQYFGIMPVVQPAANATMSALAYHVEAGYSSTTLGEWWFATSTSEECALICPPMPTLTRIPIGTQLQVRAECSGTGESLQYGILALY